MFDFNYLLQKSREYEKNKDKKYLDEIYLYYIDNTKSDSDSLYELKRNIEEYGCVRFFNILLRLYNEMRYEEEID
jgi:hypothetical protein